MLKAVLVEIPDQPELQTTPSLRSTPYANEIKEFEKRVREAFKGPVKVTNDKLNELQESLKLLRENVGEIEEGPVFISHNAEGQIVETVVATLLNVIIEAAMGEEIDPVKVRIKNTEDRQVQVDIIYSKSTFITEEIWNRLIQVLEIAFDTTKGDPTKIETDQQAEEIRFNAFHPATSWSFVWVVKNNQESAGTEAVARSALAMIGIIGNPKCMRARVDELEELRRYVTKIRPDMETQPTTFLASIAEIGRFHRWISHGLEELMRQFSDNVLLAQRKRKEYEEKEEAQSGKSFMSFYGYQLEEEIATLKELLNTHERNPYGVESVHISAEGRQWFHRKDTQSAQTHNVKVCVSFLLSEIDEAIEEEVIQKVAAEVIEEVIQKVAAEEAGQKIVEEAARMEAEKAQRILNRQAEMDAGTAAKETKRKELEDTKKKKIQEAITLAEAINIASIRQQSGEHELLVTLRIMSCESATTILLQDILKRKGEIESLCNRKNTIHPNKNGTLDNTSDALLTKAFQALQNATGMIRKAIKGMELANAMLRVGNGWDAMSEAEQKGEEVSEASRDQAFSATLKIMNCQGAPMWAHQSEMRRVVGNESKWQEWRDILIECHDSYEFLPEVEDACYLLQYVKEAFFLEECQFRESDDNSGSESPSPESREYAKQEYERQQLKKSVEEERQKAKDDNQAKNVSRKKNKRGNNNKNGEKK